MTWAIFSRPKTAWQRPREQRFPLEAAHETAAPDLGGVRRSDWLLRTAIGGGVGESGGHSQLTLPGRRGAALYGHGRTRRLSRELGVYGVLVPSRSQHTG